MAKSKTDVAGGTQNLKKNGSSYRGKVKNSNDFKEMMSCLIDDLLQERLTHYTANAVCNVAGKMMKLVEMEHRAGSYSKIGGPKTIRLVRSR